MKVQIGGTATFQDYTVAVQARWTDSDERHTYRIRNRLPSQTFEQAHQALLEAMADSDQGLDDQPRIVIEAIEDAVTRFFVGDDNGSTAVEQRLYDYLVETRDPRAPTSWKTGLNWEYVSFFEPRHMYHDSRVEGGHALTLEPGQAVMYRKAPEIYEGYPSDMDLIVEVLVGADLRLHDLYAVGRVESEVEAEVEA